MLGRVSEVIRRWFQGRAHSTYSSRHRYQPTLNLASSSIHLEQSAMQRVPHSTLNINLYLKVDAHAVNALPP